MNDESPPEPPHDDFDARYRRISAADPSRPSDAVRRAILAHAAQVADARRAPAERSPAIGRRLGPGTWRRAAAVGTLAAAALAGLLVAPRFVDWRSSTGPSVASTAAVDQGMPAAPAAARQAPAPRALAPPTESAPAAAPAAQALARRAESQAPAGTDAAVRSAAGYGDIPHLESLLGRPANLEARDTLGRTALMIAAQRGQRRAVEVLLSHGADPNAADAAGKTPLDAARAAGDPEITAALIRAGAH
jgi:hypothetical protein